MIQHDCPYCGNHLALTDDHAGRHAWCRQCRHVVLIPANPLPSARRIGHRTGEEAAADPLAEIARLKEDLVAARTARTAAEDRAVAEHVARERMEASLASAQAALVEIEAAKGRLEMELESATAAVNAATEQAAHERESREAIEEQLASERAAKGREEHEAGSEREKALEALAAERHGREQLAERLASESAARQLAEDELASERTAREALEEALAAERAARQASEQALAAQRSATENAQEALADRESAESANGSQSREAAARIEELEARLGEHERTIQTLASYYEKARSTVNTLTEAVTHERALRISVEEQLAEARAQSAPDTGADHQEAELAVQHAARGAAEQAARESAERQLAEARQVLDHQTAQLAEQSQIIEALSRDIEEAQAAVAALRQDVAREQAEREEGQRQLAESRAARDAAEEVAAQRSACQDGLERGLAETRETLEQLTNQLVQKQAAYELSQRELEDHQSARDALSRELARERAARDSVDEALQATRQQLHEALSAREDAGNTIAELEALVLQLRQDVQKEHARDWLDDAQQDVMRLQAKLAETRPDADKADRLAAHLEEASAINDALSRPTEGEAGPDSEPVHVSEAPEPEPDPSRYRVEGLDRDDGERPQTGFSDLAAQMDSFDRQSAEPVTPEVVDQEEIDSQKEMLDVLMRFLSREE